MILACLMTGTGQLVVVVVVEEVDVADSPKADAAKSAERREYAATSDSLSPSPVEIQTEIFIFLYFGQSRLVAIERRFFAHFP